MTEALKAIGGFALLFVVFLFGASTLFNSSWPWPGRLLAGIGLMGPFVLACGTLGYEMLKEPRA